jgi:hypothetical protein
MIINKNFFAELKIIFFLTLSIFILRWSTLFYSSLESFNNLILFSIEDYLYFPFILNLSEFNLKPDYLNNFFVESSLPIPIYSIILHSLFYKLFGLYSFLILEIFFFFIFIYLLTKILEKFNLNFTQSILVTLLLIIFLNINYFLKYFYSIPFFGIENLFSYRFPRPLVSSVYFLLGFLIILDFFNNHKNKNYFFYIILGLVLALNFGSVFYNFIILSLLFFFSLLIKIYNLNFYLSLPFLKKKLVLLISFIFFSLPFLWIIFNSETTYLERIGVIKLDFIQKFYLLKYLFSKIISYYFLFILLVIFYLFFSLLKKKKLNRKTIFFFLIFFLTSILSLFLFVLFSPSVTEVYHSVNLVIVSTFFTIFIFVNLIIITHINNFFFDFIKKKFKIFCTVFLLVILTLSLINNYLDKKKDIVMRNDFISLDNFFKTNSDSKKINSLLTFNSKVQVWWMFSGKNNFYSIHSIFSSLNTNILEANFLKNLKFLNITDSDLINILKNEKKGWRYNNLYLQYFSYYKYQANSLYTFNNSQDYNSDVLSFIKSSSPLYTQQIAIPNYELERISNDYKKIQTYHLDYPDIIILEKNSLIEKKSQINFLYYCELKDFNYFNIYVDKQKFECN